MTGQTREQGLVGELKDIWLLDILHIVIAYFYPR